MKPFSFGGIHFNEELEKRLSSAKWSECRMADLMTEQVNSRLKDHN